MNAAARWLRFYVVGALGMAVQTAVLAGLHRAMPRHVVFASIAAVECAIVHNFVWHLHITWRDRARGDA